MLKKKNSMNSITFSTTSFCCLFPIQDTVFLPSCLVISLLISPVLFSNSFLFLFCPLSEFFKLISIFKLVQFICV
ncbi:MAG: hypothetical protein EXX96DRAFT_579808 [Benjaminiella poitrasii]|nr:MAG: hypothetical protein EXX96DRAFT_579808 [Benjaminiella poitrasii]